MEAQPQPKPFDGNRPHTEMPARLYIAAMLMAGYTPENHYPYSFHEAISAADNLIDEHNVTLQASK